MSLSLKSYIYLLAFFMYAYVYGHVCHHRTMKVRGQLEGVDPLSPLCGYLEPSSGH